MILVHVEVERNIKIAVEGLSKECVIYGNTIRRNFKHTNRYEPKYE